MTHKLISDIPDEPGVPLENYLLNLVDEGDDVGNSLYLYDIGGFINKIWKEIIDKNRRIGVRKVLPRELKLEPTHLYKIMKNGRGISLQATRQLLILWKRYCNKTSNDIEQKWEEIYENNFPIASFSKSMKLRLPKFLMPKLSYLMGWLVGDGCFDSSKNHQRLKISEKSKAQLEKVIKPIVEEIFDVDCLVRKDHGGYCARIFSKPVFRFFRNVLDMNVGMIPKIIECSDIINKRYFLRGLFDAEGSVYANYKGSRIRIFQASKNFLNKVIKLLEDTGISANRPYGPFYKYPTKEWPVFSVWYYIEIRKKSEILKFIEKIGTSHLNKAPKMEFLANEIKNRYKYISL